jgi:hypothetical protein
MAVTRLLAARPENRDSIPSKGRDFSLSDVSRLPLGPNQHTTQWVPIPLSPGVKRPWREADHCPPLSVRLQMREAIPSLPPYAFTVWCLIKQRDTFTFIGLKAVTNLYEWATGGSRFVSRQGQSVRTGSNRRNKAVDARS